MAKLLPSRTRTLPVIVEYDHRGQRVRKTLANALKARTFYARKFKSGANPKIVR